jgi:hypothetical protein
LNNKRKDSELDQKQHISKMLTNPQSSFSLEKKQGGRKNEIIKLEKDGLTIREPEQIREECTRHYQNLLNEEPIDKSQWKVLAENIVPLTEEQQLSCEGEITYRERWERYKKLARQQVPWY